MCLLLLHEATVIITSLQNANLIFLIEKYITHTCWTQEKNILIL